ncbi:MAG: ABC transporter permease, partial [Prevotella sp.]
EQLITVKQKGDTLYYALSDSLEDDDFSRLEFLNGPDGDANSREADDIGQMPYLIKGADGKVRTAIDHNYTNDKKVRIIVNTLPGTLWVKQWDRQRTLLGAGDMKNVTVEGGDELILTSKVRVDNLTVKGKSSIDLGDAYINKLVLKSIGDDEYNRPMNVNLKAGNKGLVNLMVINGSASVDGLTDVRCKRIELTPAKDRKMNLEIRGIWRKTVIQGNE